MTTHHTSGAADLPAIQRYKIGYQSDDWGTRSSTPSGIPDASGSWVRYADHVAAIAAEQAISAEPAGACAAELRRLHAELETLPVGYINRGIAPHTKGKTVFHEKPTRNLEERWWSRDEPVFLATHGQAPATQQAGATKEHVRLVRVIADKIEDGTLFRSGIYSNKDLARFVRNVADAAAPQFPTAQAAESVPAIQGETNVQLDTDSNPTAPGQQRDMACSLALGQPVGNGQDQAAGHLGAQGDKLLTVAERNIRSFLRSAKFKGESDREAALNCVDVLWAAARKQGGSHD